MNSIDIIKTEFERRLNDESLHRISKCISLLSDEEIWNRPNENLVSVGNLVLHLSGNIEQYINSGIGGKTDIRNRPIEFETKQFLNFQQIN